VISGPGLLLLLLLLLLALPPLRMARCRDSGGTVQMIEDTTLLDQRGSQYLIADFSGKCGGKEKTKNPVLGSICCGSCTVDAVASRRLPFCSRPRIERQESTGRRQGRKRSTRWMDTNLVT
jgi:hypothetical protein